MARNNLNVFDVDVVDGYVDVDDFKNQFESLPDATRRLDGQIDDSKVKDERQSEGEESSTLIKIHEIELQRLNQYFPKEIWKKILQWLNFEDRKNFEIAFPCFGDMLKGIRREEFMFKDVIEILTKFEVGNGHWDPNSRNQKEEEEKAWFQTLNACRLTCKAWNQAVETFYQKFEMAGMMKSVRDPRKLSTPKPFSRMMQKYNITCFEEAQKFRNHFNIFLGAESPLKNPFLGRSLNFIDNDPSAANEGFYIAIRSLLENSGQHIWYCALAVGAGRKGTNQGYDWLRSFMLLMPNLKFLRVVSRGYMKVSPEFLEIHPLPTLTNLEELKLEFVQHDVVNEILLRNSHILRLNINKIAKIDDEVFRSLQNLQGLTLKNSELGLNLLTNFRAFPSCRMLNIATHAESLPGPQLFNMLADTCFEGLTDLKIKEPLRASWESQQELEFSKTVRLFLPNLRSLKLSIYDSSIFYLDFILPLQSSLEHLQVDAEFPRDIAMPVSGDKIGDIVKREQIIEFQGYQENMLDSNIWRMFPKLITIVLKAGVNRKLLYIRNI